METDGSPGMEAPQPMVVTKDYSIDLICAAFYSTEIQVQRAARGQAPTIPNQMGYLMPAIDPRTQETVIRIPEAQIEFFLLRTDIDNMRCPGANFGEAPSCSGSG